MKRVVWSEGSVLTQQHLQCLEKQLQASMNFMYFNSRAYAWGVKKINVLNYMSQGYIAIDKVEAMFPSGEYVDLSYENKNRLVSNINKSGVVYLSLLKKPILMGLNGYPEVETARWAVAYENVKDCYDVARTEEVAQLEPRLVLKSNLDDDYEQIPILKIEKKSEEFFVSDKFIPSLLTIDHRFFYEYQHKLTVILKEILDCTQMHSPFNLRLSEYLLELELVTSEMSPFDFFKLVKKIYHLVAYIFNAQYDSVTFDFFNIASTFESLEFAIKTAFGTYSPEKPRSKIIHINEHVFKIPITIKEPGMLAVRKLQAEVHWFENFINKSKLLPASKSDDVLSASASGIKLIHKPYASVQHGLTADYECFGWAFEDKFWQQAWIERSLVLFVPEGVATFQVEYLEDIL